MTTSGDVVILADGELELLGPLMKGATFFVDAGGVLDAHGLLSTTAGLDVRLSDPADWQLGPASGLEIANASGAPPGPWLDWAFVEVAGAGTDIVAANYRIFGTPAFCSRYPLPAP